MRNLYTLKGRTTHKTHETLRSLGRRFGKIGILSSILALFLIFFNSNAKAQCNQTLYLYDSYGDGWNGGNINVYVGGTYVGNYTVGSGSSATYTFSATNGQAISISYSAGGWAYENYYTVVAGNGSTLVSNWYPSSSGTWNGTAACSAPCSAPSSPGFGNNVWNVLCYDDNNFTTFKGYYTENNVNFNSAARWGTGDTPSNANGASGSAYTGCPIGIDNHSVSYKRQGFPAGTYSININRDDDYILLVDGTQVNSGGCCGWTNNTWTGNLGSSSTVEIKMREYGGGSQIQADFVAPSYCTPYTNYTCCMGISQVIFNTINNTSGNTNYTYQNFTNLSTNVEAGSTTNLFIAGWWYEQYATVWVDLNDNLVFEASERLATGVYMGYNCNIGITIPNGTSLGNHRMRIRTQYYWDGVQYDPCATTNYGETEDYTINITAPCVNNPGAVSVPASICVGTAASISNVTAATGSPGSANYSFYYRGGPSNIGWQMYDGPTTNTSSSLPGAVINTPGTWYIARNSDFGCGQANNTTTLDLQIIVNSVPTAGTISGTQTICPSGTSALTTSGNTGGTWTSSNAAVATVNSSTGLVTAIGSGSATITYTLNGGACGNAAATYAVTVLAGASAGLLSGTQTACVGATTTFTSNGTAGGTWSSDNSGIASVNASTGVITGVGAGSATITYTVSGSGGCPNVTATRTVTISVSPTANAGSDVAICNGTPINLNENQSSLSSVLDAINSNQTSLISSIPSPYGFNMDMGVNSNYISDGGNDMYDGGNYISTNLGSAITYSDNLVVTNGAFGSGGKYFTRVIGNQSYSNTSPTLFYWAADINGVSSVSITGNNGADGSGSQDLNTFSVTASGITYTCFLKRVYGTSDPSINQLFIIPNPTSANQTMGASTDDGLHTISGLTGVNRMYYMLYAGNTGAAISIPSATSIAQTFVNIIPVTTYSWTSIPAGFTSTSPNITVSPTVSTTYTLTVTSNGCSATDQVVVSMRTIPGAPTVSGNPTTICPGNTTQLAVEGLAPSGQAFQGNGSNSYIKVYQDIPEYNFTTELWMKTAALNTGIFGVNEDGGGHDRHLYLNNGQLWARVWQGNGWNTGVTLNDNQWHHIALTVQTGVGQKVYVDGNLVATYGYDHSDFNWQTNFHIGYSSDMGNFNGLIDNVRIWNTVRTQAELSANMYLNAPIGSGLVANYLMEGNANATTSGNNGNAYNNNWVDANFLTYAWSGTGAPTPSLSQTQVTNPLFNSVNYTVSASGGGCQGIASAIVAITVNNPTLATAPTTGDMVWRGGATTDWATLGNWWQYSGTNFASATAAPTDLQNVIIPSTGTTCVLSQPNTFANAGSAKSLRIESGATLTMGNGTLSIAENMVNNGTFAPGTGTVEFTGSGTHTISGSSLAHNFNNITMNKAGEVQLSVPIAMSGALTLTNGRLDIGNSNLDLPTNTINGGNASSYVKTSGTGTLSRDVAGIAVNFPVGRSAYNAATLTNTGTADKYSIRVIDNVTDIGTNADAGATTTMAVVNRTWMINEQVAGGSDVTLGLNWNGAPEHIGGFQEASAFIAHYMSGAGLWDNIGGAVSTDLIVTSGITSFSPFTISSDLNFAPLPVELISFQANCVEDGNVEVTWATASEHNSADFTVEKSRDGSNWSVLASLAGAGNSTQVINYSVADNTAAEGTNYYRLTQTDFDGASETFNIASANCAESNELNTINVYPNPSTGDFYIDFTSVDILGTSAISITDARGSEIYTQSVMVEKGSNVFHIDNMEAAPGIYYIKVSNGTNTSNIVKHSLR
jgi:hypothetical protein